jgi:hypothetical protein
LFFPRGHPKPAPWLVSGDDFDALQVAVSK